ncbi:cytochrome c biogenesis protein CcsA [Geobacter sp. OR-1]|uniref:cytochrome c biogenesis protein CcsA n=1 Tax=Geobacter sp. OR-1 TaxID=1266765 RepID=UPI00054332AA|nr:cytochrome c biogenesis protein CcsA [Geobacter sp. OR-1]GAM10213.1 cytochrome c biogenesis protein CcsA [Geobacter sp. OR-1]
MSLIEGLLLWPAMFGYLTVFILYLTLAIFKKDRVERVAWLLFIISFLVQTASILWRWHVSGRAPVMVSYEHYQLGSWFVGLVTIASGYRYRQTRIFAMASAAAMLLMLGMGLGTETAMEPMRPPFRSNWLIIHIGFAWFAWGCFVMAAAMGVAFLLKRPGKGEGPLLAKFPDRKVIDDLMIKQVLFGFVCQGLMIIAGAIWAHQLWGRYWGWDPIETWSLICWLVYGVVLHLRLMMGWREDKLAILVILALSTSVICFWGIGLGPQSHTTLMLMEFK